jgi:hypothetical protein
MKNTANLCHQKPLNCAPTRPVLKGLGLAQHPVKANAALDVASGCGQLANQLYSLVIKAELLSIVA